MKYYQGCKNELSIKYIPDLINHPEYSLLVEQVSVCARKRSCDMKVWNETDYTRIAKNINWYYEWTLKPIVDPFDGEKIHPEDYFFYYYDEVTEENIKDYYQQYILWWLKATYYDKIPTSPYNDAFMWRYELRQREVVKDETKCRFLHLKGSDGKPHRKPLAIQFILDYSGSIQANQQAVSNMEQGVKNFISCSGGVKTCRQKDDKVGCIKFTKDKYLSITTDENKLNAIFSNETGMVSLPTGTYQNSGFAKCQGVAVTDLVTNGGDGYTKVIICLTDGNNPNLVDIKGPGKSNDVRINYIGFGPELSNSTRKTMKEIASYTGGIYKEAPTVGDIMAAFDECLATTTEMGSPDSIGGILDDSEKTPPVFHYYKLNEKDTGMKVTGNTIEIDRKEMISDEDYDKIDSISGYTLEVISEQNVTFKGSFSKKDDNTLKVSDGNFFSTFNAANKLSNIKLCIKYKITVIENYWEKIRIKSNCNCKNCCAVCCRGIPQENNMPEPIIDFYKVYHEEELRKYRGKLQKK